MDEGNRNHTVDGYVHPTGLWKVITNIGMMMEMQVDFR